MMPFWCACCTPAHTLAEQLDAFQDVEAVLVAIAGERQSFNQLHHEVGLSAFGRIGGEHPRDAAVAHGGERPSLQLEPRYDLAAVHSQLDDLQRHLAPHRLHLLGDVDRSHAALAEDVEHPVRSDPFRWVGRSRILRFEGPGHLVRVAQERRLVRMLDASLIQRRRLVRTRARHDCTEQALDGVAAGRGRWVGPVGLAASGMAASSLTVSASSVIGSRPTLARISHEAPEQYAPTPLWRSGLCMRVAGSARHRPSGCVRWKLSRTRPHPSQWRAPAL